MITSAQPKPTEKLSASANGHAIKSCPGIQFGPAEHAIQMRDRHKLAFDDAMDVHVAGHGKFCGLGVQGGSVLGGNVPEPGLALSCSLLV